MKVQGRCPACGRDTLMLASGGYVTCGWIDSPPCPNPDAASDALVLRKPDQGGVMSGKTYVPNQVTVNGNHVAFDLGNALVMADDDGTLWRLEYIAADHVVVMNAEEYEAYCEWETERGESDE